MFFWLRLPGNHFRILHFVPDSVCYRRRSQKRRRILACFNSVFTLMVCESNSKIFNFSPTAEKKKQLCEATKLPFLGRLSLARISCLIVNKCRCVWKMESTSTWNERNIWQTCCKIGLNYVGESSRKSSVKSAVKFSFYVMFTILIQ